MRKNRKERLNRMSDDMINLDDLGSGKPKEETTNVPLGDTTGETGLIFVGSGKKSNTQLPQARTISDIYAHHQKLVYLIDVSASMMGTVAGTEDIRLYLWSPETMTKIRAAIADADAKVNAAFPDDNEDDEDDDAGFTDIPVVSDEMKVLASLKTLGDDEVKLALLKAGLAGNFAPRNWAVTGELTSKLGLVKKMAKKMVDERYQKYPDADVECMVFDTRVKFLGSRTPDELLTSIEAIQLGGGTDIFGAVKTAIDLCKDQPSRIKLHHLVLVTDGADGGAKTLPDLLDSMKDEGVVLDFIWIRNPQEDMYTMEAAKVIEQVVKATGGTYKEVSNAKEFETQFLEASTRKLLPSGKG